MSLNSTDISLPPHFSGVVRLFPLPDLVLYPGVVQALHIFEPRYRKMADDALAADMLIGMALYQDSKQALEDTQQPVIRQHVCISKIMAHKELDDGRFNLLVAGVKRATIVRELATNQPYRMAEVDLIDDEMPSVDATTKALRAELIETCESLDVFGKLTRQIETKKILGSGFPLGLLVDLISFSGELNCEHRQTILELANVEVRCRKLIEFLHQIEAESTSTFPPDFSSN